jgi:hypothetical protein
MTRHLPLVALLALGCDDPAVPGDDAGTQPPASTGSTSSAPTLVWKDSTGAVVGPGTQQPTYVDAAGILWPVDYETGQVMAAFARPLAFPTQDCSGPAYLQTPPAPREAFRVAGDASWRVRPDGLKSAPFTYGSWRTPTSGCIASPGSTTTFQLAAAPVVQPPALSVSPPLRLERP